MLWNKLCDVMSKTVTVGVSVLQTSLCALPACFSLLDGVDSDKALINCVNSVIVLSLQSMMPYRSSCDLFHT